MILKVLKSSVEIDFSPHKIKEKWEWEEASKSRKKSKKTVEKSRKIKPQTDKTQDSGTAAEQLSAFFAAWLLWVFAPAPNLFQILCQPFPKLCKPFPKVCKPFPKLCKPFPKFASLFQSFKAFSKAIPAVSAQTSAFSNAVVTQTWNLSQNSNLQVCHLALTLSSTVESKSCTWVLLCWKGEHC